MSRAISLLPLWAFMACYRVNFTLYIYISCQSGGRLYSNVSSLRKLSTSASQYRRPSNNFLLPSGIRLVTDNYTVGYFKTSGVIMMDDPVIRIQRAPSKNESLLKTHHWEAPSWNNTTNNADRKSAKICIYILKHVRNT